MKANRPSQLFTLSRRKGDEGRSKRGLAKSEIIKKKKKERENEFRQTS